MLLLVCEVLAHVAAVLPLPREELLAHRAAPQCGRIATHEPGFLRAFLVVAADLAAKIRFVFQGPLVAAFTRAALVPNTLEPKIISIEIAVLGFRYAHEGRPFCVARQRASRCALRQRTVQ